MSPLHRYLGNPVLSKIGRLFFRSKIGDFHCGLRGFRRDRILTLDLQSGGMEFASEMAVKATLGGLDVQEVPTTLSPDGRSRPPHLRTWHDGWRHLRFLLIYSPRWLFFYPGIVLCALALVLGILVEITTVRIGSVTLGVDTLVVCYAMLIIGFQSVIFAVLTKKYGTNEGFLPPNPTFERILRQVSFGRGVVMGLILFVVGVAGLVVAILKWRTVGFGSLNPTEELNIVIPSVALLTVGSQGALASAFLSVVDIRRRAVATGGTLGRTSLRNWRTKRPDSRPQPGWFFDSRCSPSCHRAMAHKRSESRFRYIGTRESTGGSLTAMRSERRTMVRAKSRAAATRFSPGMVKSVGMSKRLSRSSIPSSNASTMSGVTKLDPALSLLRFSGAVATSAIKT
jgi:hypothetical protein